MPCTITTSTIAMPMGVAVDRGVRRRARPCGPVGGPGGTESERREQCRGRCYIRITPYVSRTRYAYDSHDARTPRPKQAATGAYTLQPTQIRVSHRI